MSNHDPQQNDTPIFIQSAAERDREVKEQRAEQDHRLLLDLQRTQTEAQVLQAKANWAIVALTAGLVVVAILNAVVSYWQFRAAKISADAAQSAATTAQKTLDSMNASGDQTKAQIDRLIAQETRTADSMKDTVSQSKAALDATMSIFRNDQRAWLGYMESTDISFKADQKPTITHWFGNTGKTPAVGVKGHASSITLARGEKFRPNYAKSDSIQSDTIIMPNQRLFIKAEASGVFTQILLDDLAAKLHTQYFFGEVCYADIFKRQHHTTFCNFLNPDLTTLGNCQVYNQIDDQPSDYCDQR